MCSRSGKAGSSDWALPTLSPSPTESQLGMNSGEADIQGGGAVVRVNQSGAYISAGNHEERLQHAEVVFELLSDLHILQPGG